MKAILTLFVVMAVLFFTNPKKDSHMTTVQDHVRDQGKDAKGPLGKVLADVAGGIMGGLEPAFEWKNYYIFSTMQIDEEVWTVGALGMVFYVHDDEQ